MWEELFYILKGTNVDENNQQTYWTLRDKRRQGGLKLEG